MKLRLGLSKYSHKELNKIKTKLLLLSQLVYQWVASLKAPIYNLAGFLVPLLLGPLTASEQVNIFLRTCFIFDTKNLEGRPLSINRRMYLEVA